MTLDASRAVLISCLVGLSGAVLAQDAPSGATKSPDAPEAPKPAAKEPAAAPGSAAAGQSSLLSGLYDAVEEIGKGDRPWLLPGRSRGSIGFIFTNQKWDTSFNVLTAAGEERRTTEITNRLMTEYFTARYENFSVLAPQLVNGSIAILGGLQQYHIDTNGDPTNQNGWLLGYEFALNFLDESPYPASLYANREQSTVTLPLGGTEDVLVQNRGITMRWLDTSILRDREILPHFSASLQALQENTRTTTSVAGQRLRRENDRDIVRLAADNGGETSDTSFRYIFTRYTDRYFDTLSYNDQNVLFDYSLDFGPNLNRTWYSDIQYRTNSGTAISAISELDVQQTLSVWHYTSLSSFYYYTYVRQDSSLGVVNSQSASAQVQYAPFDNLSAYLSGTGLRSDLPSGELSAAGAQGFLYYEHKVPWQGSVNASGGYGYLITDSHIPGGTVPVVDAPYVAPGSFGLDQQILLRDPFIVASTIRVVAIKGDGARLPAAVGIDYLVIAEGYRTFIQPLPTSLIIQPGDPLRISYVFDAPSDLRYRTTTRNATIGGSWPSFYVNYTRSDSDVTPLTAGDPTQLVSFRSDQLDLGVNSSWNNFIARGDARLYRYDSTGLAYRRLSATESLTYQPSPDFSCQLGAAQFELDYARPARTSRGQSIHAGFTYNYGRWTATGYALMRRISDTILPTERYEEAGLRWQGRWGKLSLGVNGYGSWRSYAGTETRGLGGQFNVVREF